jgi:hypothetical protein
MFISGGKPGTRPACSPASGFAQEGWSAGVMPAKAGIQVAGRSGFPPSRE